MTKSASESPWAVELHHLVHDLAGAFLFGVPFLYTMEVWWRGNTSGPARMIAALALTFVALLALERAAKTEGRGRVPWLRAAAEAAQGLATGLVAATAGLLLIGFITPEDGLHAVVGRVVMEGLPFSLGVGLADFLLGEKDDGAHDKGGGRGEGEQGSGGGGEKAGGAGYQILTRAGATAFGATVIALALTSTDEIPLIASNLSYPRLLCVVGASLVVSYLIVFASNFVSTEAREAHGGGFDAPLAETAASYAVSLLMAAGMLWLYQSLHVGDPPDRWLSFAVVLGLPASVGGAAGRLAA
jgi:putative integral membrane protein (TIGR02587 family)